MASDRSGLTPHRRKHWSVEPAAQPEAPVDELLSPEETRVEAKRLLWRDSAVILIGIVVALLFARFLPNLAPGLVADQSASASGPGALRTAAPGDSVPPEATLGPVIDPSLGVGATQPPTQPPTGTFEPAETDDPTPKPTKKPQPTSRPPTPPPTPEPTPDPTPEVTQVPAPDAAFSWSATLLAVSFTNASTDAESWEWDFGDGAGSTERNPEHLYLAPGEYTVRLTVTGPGGTDSIEDIVTVVDI
jgi:hypothetical protein